MNLNGRLAGTLAAPIAISSKASTNPTVGEVFKVLNFANNFLGDFADFSVPLLGSNEYLKESLSSSGLSYTVTQGQPPSSAVRAASLASARP